MNKPNNADEVQFMHSDYQGRFARAGLLDFESLWNLPHNFVEEPNIRRGGWSGAAQFMINDLDAPQTFYIKRQVNQLRRSLRFPLGALTFRHELVSITRNRSLGLPAVEVICAGFRRQNKSDEGFIVTEAIKHPPLEHLADARGGWSACSEILCELGNTLHSMHTHRIRHGALYPQHIFVDPANGKINLIDFERSRRSLTVESAIRHDLKQLLKRIHWMPASARDNLLHVYLSKHRKLTYSLLDDAA